MMIINFDVADTVIEVHELKSNNGMDNKKVYGVHKVFDINMVIKHVIGTADLPVSGSNEKNCKLHLLTNLPHVKIAYKKQLRKNISIGSYEDEKNFTAED